MKVSSKEIAHLNYNGIFKNGKQTAEILGVSPPTLSEAVKYGYNCGGYPVEEWVIRSDSGRVRGYYVPEFLVKGEHEERENPQEDPENSNKVNEEQASEDTTSKVTHNNYSLLPEGEDYFRPVGATAISSVIEKALESDTFQSKVLTITGATLLSSITGNAITGDAKGALTGGILGLGVIGLAYGLNHHQNYQQALPNQAKNNQPNKDQDDRSESLPEITLEKLDQ